MSDRLKKTRVQLDMGKRSMDRLKAMKEATEAVSYAEVIRYSLQLYEALIEEHEAGNSFLLKTPSGDTRPYKMFIDV